MRIILVIFTAILVASCSRENSDQFYPYDWHELNDTNWHATVPQSARVRQLDSIFAIAPLTDSVSINGGTVVFNDSIAVTFPQGFVSGGTSPGTGKVKVEIILLSTKGDMVKSDRPTMSYDHLLITGGALHIRVTYNNVPLQLDQGKTFYVRMVSKMSNTNPSSQMKVFFGKEDAYPSTAVQQFTWLPWMDTTVNGVSSYLDNSNGKRGYEFLSDRFGWLNSGQYTDTMHPRTKVMVTLPPNFTNANTNVYAVVHAPDDIVAQLVADPVTKSFGLENMYTGKTVTFVSMTYMGGNLYLGNNTVTIAPNTNVNIVPVQKTKQEIDMFLQTL